MQSPLLLKKGPVHVWHLQLLACTKQPGISGHKDESQEASALVEQGTSSAPVGHTVQTWHMFMSSTKWPWEHCVH